MFRDLGRVHIASFAVGIVGLVVGIVGIVLAIVFGTATHTCPTTPTCPPVITQQPCNSQLFSIRTDVLSIPWNDTYHNPNDAATNQTRKDIEAMLTQSLNSGLNAQSSLIRILAATVDAQSNNAAVQILSLEQSTDGKTVVAVGSGAVSSAQPIDQIPKSDQVQQVIQNQNTTYSTVITSPQACSNKTDCPACPTSLPVTVGSTLPATSCPICPSVSPQPSCPSVSCPACPSASPATSATSVTCPAVTCPTVTCPAVTQTICTTPQPVVTSSAVPVGSSSAAPATSSQAPTASSSAAPITTAAPATSQPTTTQGAATSTTGSPITTQGTTVSTPGATSPPVTTGVPTSSPVPSSTQGAASSSTAPNTSPTTPSISSTQGATGTPTQTSTSSSGQSSTTTAGTVLTTQGTPSPVPSTSAPQTSPTQGVASSSPIPSSTPGAVSSSTAPHTSPTTPSSTPSSTQGVATSTQTPQPSTPPSTSGPSVPTIGPNQCYYQSNVAVAFELVNPDSDADKKIQNFIENNLLFYPGNPYQFGKKDTQLTQLALVPYPPNDAMESLMGYGAAATQSEIVALVNQFDNFAQQSPDISGAFNVIASLQRSGSPGFVILVGNDGSQIAQSAASAQNLKALGFNVITIGYNSNADFSPLASGTYSFQVNKDSDELSVAQQIGNILNSTYCTQGSTTVAPATSPVPVTSSVAPASSSSAPASSSTAPVTSTTAPQSSSAAPTSSSAAPATSSAAPQTSSTAPATSSSAPSSSSSAAPITSSAAPQSSSAAPASPTTTIGASSSTAAAQSSSTAPITSTAVPGTSTPAPTFSPDQKYYQSNVAVAFELTDAASELDLQIQNFIVNDLLFYPGSPYQLGGQKDGKTALSLVPYPNDGTAGPLTQLMDYGFAKTQPEIRSSFDLFDNFARGPASIVDAFNLIPDLQRTGAPGFVILVANSADSVNNAVDSAATLKNLGFQIVTIAFKSTGSFDNLASQASYNFKIQQDADQSTVASQIGNLLNSTLWSGGSTTVGPTGSTQTVISSSTTVPSVSSSTATVPQSSSTSPQQSTTQPSSSSSAASTAPASSSSVASSTVSQSASSSTAAPTTTVYGSSSTATVQTTTQSGSSTVPSSSSSTVPQPSTTQSASSSSVGSTVTVPSSSSTVPQQSTTQSASSSSIGSTSPAASTTVTVPTTTGAPSSTIASSTVPSTSGSTTSQICPNQQVVFQGQIGVIFELLPSSSSTQQSVINAFVENTLLNSNLYGLAVDNLTGENRTLVSAIPYPSTDKYNVQGYGLTRSQADFNSQVDAFNAAIQPVSGGSDLSDALLYVTSNPSSGNAPSALIIVGNSAAMIDAGSSALADGLRNTYSIFTVAVGDNAADLSGLSSGAGYSFTGNSQQIADQIAQKLETSNPAVYCPPPTPSTSAPITSTVQQTSTTVTSTVTSTTTFTTTRPTVGPCQCQGRWVYNGDLSIAFEFVKDSDGSQKVVDFLNNTLLKNADSYGLTNDVNGNQPSKLELLPYPQTGDYPIFGYGSIKSSGDIGSFLSAYQGIQFQDTDPSITDAFDYIESHQGPSDVQAVLLVASDGSDVQKAVATANALKNAGYLVITVAQTSPANVFSPLASGDKYSLQIGNGNDEDVAAQIASLLLDWSFVCFDDGSSTAAPTTRCPGTQGTTQSGVSSTTAVPVVSSSTAGSTTVAPASSSTIQSSSTQPAASSTIASTVTGSGSSTTQASGSSTTVGSTVTDSGSSTTQPAVSSTVGSTVTDSGSSTTQVPAGSSTTAGSTVYQSSTVANTGSTTIGSTVTDSGSSTTQVPSGSSTTAGSTVTTVPAATSTVTQDNLSTSPLPSTTPIHLCDSPYSGKIATVFELNTRQAEIQSVVNFVRDNLYNSNNYNFGTITNAINVPYANTDNYADNILAYDGAKSLADLQTNIDTLNTNAVVTVNPTISDGLEWLYTYRSPGTTKAVIVIVGNHQDDDTGSTSSWLQKLRQQGYQVISVGVGSAHADFSSLADKPEWYFQVGDTNGQYVADQISSILCSPAGSTTVAPASSSTISSFSTQPAASSTIASTVTGSGSSTTQASGSSTTAGSTVTDSGSSTTQPAVSSTVGSTVTDSGSSTTQVPAGSSTTAGSTVYQSSTVANTGSTTIGSTVTDSGSSTTQPVSGSSTTAGSTVSQSSTVANTGSTTIGSTVTDSGSSTTQPAASSTVGSTVTIVATGSSSTVGSTVTDSGTSTAQVAGSSTTAGSTMPPSSTVANTGSTMTDSGSSTTQPAASSTVGSTVTDSGSSTTQAPGSSSTIGSTVTDSGSSTTQVPSGSSTTAGSTVTTVPAATSTVTQDNLSTSPFPSTTPIPPCDSPYSGKIATVFELNTRQAEIQSVVNFVRDNLYNSNNYNFGAITNAINVPYANTDNYADNILAYDGAKSLTDLQTNIDTLNTNAVVTVNPTISDGLQWLYANRSPGTTKAVIVIVGNHQDDDTGSTTIWLRSLKQQGYQVISVGVGSAHADFSSLADKPEWYFQVGDTNGQYVADQISSILCHL